MRRVPWHLAFRAGRKGAMTTAGVALAVAFSVASFSVAHGLEGDILGLARNHQGTTLVVRAVDGAPFDVSSLAAFSAARGVVLREGLAADGAQVMVVCYLGPGAPSIPVGLAHGGGAAGPLVADGVELTILEVPDPLTPIGWFMANASSFGAPPTQVRHALLPDATLDDEARLRAMGFETERVPALQSFFRTSGLEIAGDLLLVVAFASILAMLFSYEFLRSEVRERRREIGVWRALGMRPNEVVQLFLLRSAVIASAGFAAGVVVALGALAVADGATQRDVFAAAATIQEIVALGAAFVLASLLGAALPAIAAGRIGVQQAMESAP